MNKDYHYFKNIVAVNKFVVIDLVNSIKDYGFNISLFVPLEVDYDKFFVEINGLYYHDSSNGLYELLMEILFLLEQNKNAQESFERKARSTLVDYLSKMEDDTNYTFSVSLCKK